MFAWGCKLVIVVVRRHFVVGLRCRSMQISKGWASAGDCAQVTPRLGQRRRREALLFSSLDLKISAHLAAEFTLEVPLLVAVVGPPYPLL